MIQHLLAASLSLGAPLVAGHAHFCALDSEGVKCFRPNGGDGFAADAPLFDAGCALDPDPSAGCVEALRTVAPARVHGPRPAGLAAGARNTCAWTDRGEVYCWGAASGINTKIPRDLGRIHDLAVGEFRACAQTDTGVRCWGMDACLTGGEPGTGLAHNGAFAASASLAVAQSLVCASWTPASTQRRTLECNWCYMSPHGGPLVFRRSVGGWSAPRLLAAENRLLCGVTDAGATASGASVGCDEALALDLTGAAEQRPLHGRSDPSHLRRPFQLVTSGGLVYVADVDGVKWAEARTLMQSERHDQPLRPLLDVGPVDAVAAAGSHACTISGQDLRCFRSQSGQPPQRVTAGVPALVVFSFAPEHAAAALRRLADVVYADKAALLDAAAALLAETTDDDARLAVLNLLAPVVQAVTTRYVGAEIGPAYARDLRAANAAHGVAALADIPRSPAVDDAALALLAHAVEPLRDQTADPVARARLDAVLAAAGRARAADPLTAGRTAPVRAALDAAAGEMDADRAGFGMLGLMLAEYWR